jgi:hypothetical protein
MILWCWRAIKGSETMDRIEAGRLAPVGDQSGENAGGGPEGRRSESGLSGIHVPLLRDLKGRGWRYLNVSPSAKALKKEREKLHEMTIIVISASSRSRN